MSKVAVVYWSGTGNTQQMAEHIAKTANADIFTSAEFGSDKMDDYAGIAFGCPSMGAEVLEESEFAPMFDSVKGKLKGKKIALFGSYGWGDGEWMRNWDEECRAAGAYIFNDYVICNGAPAGDVFDALTDLANNLAKC